MINKFESSIQIDLHLLQGKPFKVVADLIRSGIKNEHGFNGTKGVKDVNLQAWSVLIRFKEKVNRDSFEDTIRKVIHPEILKKISIKHLTPTRSATQVVRMVAIR